jgi:hypothetical protein
MDAIYKDFLAVVDKGDEKAARDFLVTNINKFPEEVRDEIIFAFFEEALIKKASEEKMITEFQKQGLEEIKMLEKAKKIVEAKAKMLD